MHAVPPSDSLTPRVPSPGTLERLTDTPRTRRLIENRICYAGPHAELSIYDTWWPARDVALSAERVLYCGMRLRTTRAGSGHRRKSSPSRP